MQPVTFQFGAVPGTIGHQQPQIPPLGKALGKIGMQISGYFAAASLRLDDARNADELVADIDYESRPNIVVQRGINDLERPMRWNRVAITESEIGVGDG